MKILKHEELEPSPDLEHVAEHFEIPLETLVAEGRKTLYLVEGGGLQGEDVYVLLWRRQDFSWCGYIIAPNADIFTMCDVHWGWTLAATPVENNVLPFFEEKILAAPPSGVWSIIGMDAYHYGDRNFHRAGAVKRDYETYKTKEYVLKDLLRVLQPEVVATFNDIRSLCNGSDVDKGYALLALFTNRYEASELCKSYLQTWYKHLSQEAAKTYLTAVLEMEPRFWNTEDARVLFAKTLGTVQPPTNVQISAQQEEYIRYQVDFCLQYLQTIHGVI